jgi:hypothetical protein
MYKEHFIVAMQLMIVPVAINAIFLTRDQNVLLIDHKQNLIPKLAYWPVLLFTLLVATFWAFLPHAPAGAEHDEPPDPPGATHAEAPETP